MERDGLLTAEDTFEVRRFELREFANASVLHREQEHGLWADFDGCFRAAVTLLIGLLRDGFPFAAPQVELANVVAEIQRFRTGRIALHHHHSLAFAGKNMIHTAARQRQAAEILRSAEQRCSGALRHEQFTGRTIGVEQTLFIAEGLRHEDGVPLLSRGEHPLHQIEHAARRVVL